MTKFALTEKSSIYRWNFPLPEGTIVYLDDNGCLHNDSGPAIVYPGGKTNWFVHGECHREGGPAIECPLGDNEWWYKDICIADHTGIMYANFEEFYGVRVPVIELQKFVIRNRPDLIKDLFLYYELQEYICRERPDLVGKIRDLNPDLKAKYRHELELAGVDL